MAIFPAAVVRQKRRKLWPLKSRLQNNFQTSGRKSTRLNRPFPTTLASRGLVSATRLKVSARLMQHKGGRAREHRRRKHENTYTHTPCTSRSYHCHLHIPVLCISTRTACLLQPPPWLVLCIECHPLRNNRAPLFLQRWLSFRGKGASASFPTRSQQAQVCATCVAGS